MTWECPNCERRYPDSGIGVPENAEAHEKELCEVCGRESSTAPIADGGDR